MGKHISTLVTGIQKNALRIGVGQKSLGNFIYFLLTIRYSQDGEMCSFLFLKIEVLHQADQTSHLTLNNLNLEFIFVPSELSTYFNRSFATPAL